ncbi:MAG: hypothetical protein H7A46_06270 [Verrucomicrobiales bacterium]|nr:hypothetical protein [Verrucomicrobiales bacterium]
MNPSSKAEPESAFESRLRRQVIRPVPVQWREAILQEAAAAAHREGETPSNQHVVRRSVNLLRWFSLPRLGWLGLGATWGLILALHIAGQPEPLSDLAGRPPAASEAWAAWTQNQRELARLLDTEPAFAPPPASRPPRQQGSLPRFVPTA